MCDWPSFSTCCIGVAISGPSVMFVGLLEGVINAYIYIYRTTINYSSYWSYVHQLSYHTGAPPSIINSSCLHLSPLSWWASTSASSGDCDDAKLPGRIFLWASWGTGTVAVGYLFMSFLNGNINCHHLFCRLYPCFLSMFFFSNGIISIIKRIQRRLFIPHITDQWLHMDVFEHGHRPWK